MKTTLLLLALFIYNVLYADICTSLGDGDWTDASNWSCGHVPGDGDTAIIDHIINVNCNCGVYNDMHIEINETLNFENGQKILLDALGTVQINTGGSVTGGNPGTKIEIDGTEIWNGAEGTIDGPASVDSSSTSFESGYLPIVLKYFTVSKDYNKDFNIIIWATQSEINNSHFLIQRSYDTETWECIKIIEGAGNSNQPLYYKIIDSNLLPLITYYRLTQVDFDGKNTCSKIVAIDCRKEIKRKTLNLQGMNIENDTKGFQIIVYSTYTVKTYKN